MKTGTLLKTSLATMLAATLLPLTALATDEGNPSMQVSRSASSALELTGNVYRNVYHYEDREETYTVEVPYTEYITERVCDEEHYTETECRSVRKCDNLSNPPRCWDEEVCREIPRTRTVCRNETREITRYRTEYRTRIVSVPVFDYRFGTRVEVVFPEESALIAGESEKLRIDLTGDRHAPDAVISVESAIFRYEVASKSNAQGTVVFVLKALPRYSAQSLAEASIDRVEIQKISRFDQRLQILDNGLKGRQSSAYQIVISDSKTGERLFTAQASASGGATVPLVDLPIYIKDDMDLDVALDVTRQGVSIEGGTVRFQKTVKYLGKIDATEFQDPAMIAGAKITGANQTAEFVFEDRSPQHSDVQTRFQVVLRRDVGYRDVMGTITLERGGALDLGGGRFAIPVDQFQGITTGRLDDHFDKGDGIVAEISVVRKSQRFPGSPAITFQASAKMKVGK